MPNFLELCPQIMTPAGLDSCGWPSLPFLAGASFLLALLSGNCELCATVASTFLGSSHRPFGPGKIPSGWLSIHVVDGNARIQPKSRQLRITQVLLETIASHLSCLSLVLLCPSHQLVDLIFPYVILCQNPCSSALCCLEALREPRRPWFHMFHCSTPHILLSSSTFQNSCPTPYHYPFIPLQQPYLRGVN